jgi:hypothetical protein
VILPSRFPIRSNAAAVAPSLRCSTTHILKNDNDNVNDSSNANSKNIKDSNNNNNNNNINFSNITI